MIVRFPFVIVGGVIAAIRGERLVSRQPFDVLEQWEQHALDRYVVAALPVVVLAVVSPLSLPRPTLVAAASCSMPASRCVLGYLLCARRLARALASSPITCSRWSRSRRCARSTCVGCYALLGVSVLAKGPPGVAVVVVVAFHVVLLGRWRELYEGASRSSAAS